MFGDAPSGDLECSLWSGVLWLQTALASPNSQIHLLDSDRTPSALCCGLESKAVNDDDCGAHLVCFIHFVSFYKVVSVGWGTLFSFTLAWLQAEVLDCLSSYWFWSMCVRLLLSCVWLFAIPLDSIPPGSSVHGILQARVLEWVAISSSRGSSWPNDSTQVSRVPCIAGGFFTCWAIEEINAEHWF